MIASLLTLSKADMKALKVTDAYSIHRIVYDLFEDVRTEDEKKASVSSGLSYADKGGDANKREILIFSNRPPKLPAIGSIESKKIEDSFLSHSHYRFEVVINPTKRESKTGKLIAIRGREAIGEWFMKKAPAWGFSVKAETFQVEEIQVCTFMKSKNQVTHSHAKLVGELSVVNRDHFINSFKQGIGRGRAFGLGLLQIIPLTKI